jgi:3-dehydroquinate synthase
MLTQLKVSLKARARTKYSILLENGVLSNWQSWLSIHCPDKQIVIITDKIVENLYAYSFSKKLTNNGYNVLLLSIEPGEESKVQKTKEYLELEMLKAKFGRNTLLIAFGGGIVGDLAGFVAATYMRGIRYIQLPTTLLSMIDSSVGGKTAINTPYGKNMIGVIYQPSLVVMDLSLLNSLSKVLIVNGLIEALKIFLTLDNKSFTYARLNINKLIEREPHSLKSVIARAVKLKVKVVRIDEFEENLRMILNFGHTIAHALEKLSNYHILHGYAVALGILVEAKISQLMGVLSSENYDLISRVFYSIGISKEMLSAFNADEVVSIAKGDKKNHGGKIFFILLKDIGEVYTKNDRVATPVDEKYILQAFNSLL